MSNYDRPQLVLDVAGVLVTNLSPSFWQQLSAKSKIPYDSLKVRFDEEIRAALWSGDIPEEQFWTWLHTGFPQIEIDYARTLLYTSMKSLPAIRNLTEWSRLADIHLLSNHRREWLAPVLSSIQKHVKSITISSDTGYCKPDPRIYATVMTHTGARKMILFVDDQEKNLKQASLFGWNTLLADDKGEWMKSIVPFLKGFSGALNDESEA